MELHYAGQVFTIPGNAAFLARFATPGYYTFPSEEGQVTLLTGPGIPAYIIDRDAEPGMRSHTFVAFGEDATKPRPGLVRMSALDADGKATDVFQDGVKLPREEWQPLPIDEDGH